MPKNLRRPVPVKPVGANISSGGSYNLEEANEAAYKASKTQLVQCENCGRRFQPDRLFVHQRSCKPGNAAKPIGSNNANNYDDGYSNQPQQQQGPSAAAPKAPPRKFNPNAPPAQNNNIDNMKVGGGGGGPQISMI